MMWQRYARGAPRSLTSLSFGKASRISTVKPVLRSRMPVHQRLQTLSGLATRNTIHRSTQIRSFHISWTRLNENRPNKEVRARTMVIKIIIAIKKMAKTKEMSLVHYQNTSDLRNLLIRCFWPSDSQLYLLCSHLPVTTQETTLTASWLSRISKQNTWRRVLCPRFTSLISFS